MTVHPVTIEPEEPPLYFIASNDGNAGFCIGEMRQVAQLWQRLGRLLAMGEHDGELDEFDDRIEPWITAAEAARERDIPLRTLQYACANGHIERAMLDEHTGQWTFPRNSLNKWIARRAPGGRFKTKSN